MNIHSCTALKQPAYQTEEIRNSLDRHQIGRVVTALIERYLGKNANWVVRPNKGSVTLQNEQDSHEVVTIFKDYGNKLSGQGFPAVDPVTVAIELCPQTQFARTAIRQALEKTFLGNYLNPDKGHSEYRLLPNLEHHFDLVFLGKTPCEITDEGLLEQILRILDPEQGSWGKSVKISDLGEVNPSAG